MDRFGQICLFVFNIISKKVTHGALYLHIQKFLRKQNLCDEFEGTSFVLLHAATYSTVLKPYSVAEAEPDTRDVAH